MPEWSNGTLIVGNDSFDFMVVDNEGALSLPTDYKIEVFLAYTLYNLHMVIQYIGADMSLWYIVVIRE